MTLSLFDAGPPPPCPARFNMAAHTLGHDRAAPEKIALEVLSAPGAVAESWSYAQLRAAVLAAAGGLAARGIGRGDRILLRIGNSSDFPILFFAANALGAVPVPTSTQLTEAEVAGIVADLDPALILAAEGVACPPAGNRLDTAAIAAIRAHAPAAGFAETAADDPAYMVYTSGTGGRPKGVVHAQRAAWARRMMWQGWYGLAPSDRMLHAGAFNWTYTLGAGLTDPWAIGATALIHAGPPDRGVWPALARAHRATIFAATPGVYRQILGSEADLAAGFAHLRHGLSAGEAMPEAVRAGFRARAGREVYEALGMSEVSTYISFAPAAPPVPGRAGRPQPGRRVAILPDSERDGETPVPRGEHGLLAVSRRDPGLMLGYWRRPEETAANFRGEWFLTGDRAEMAADDTITYHGRADDLLNAGGFRVSPAEVETALLAHPAVGEVAVVEREVRPGVTVIAAFYVAEGPAPAEEELASHCAARLARYKCPRAFIALETLPRSANGKIIRRALKEGWP
ncbi:class I adenylate-forming enzyme family protein [Amaricoccus solimangrovi]|uniref:Long-chain fatty acid--CoA ligase n=1 Tax=Amaricoccus solimangrovi TaxID=2589815 RepID=A0A501WPU1_9RHOB|nr:AMP-binding protein [Amaricoccus solimangrovi]TPE51358.1 long-chain fatty acid--CoA ligase [Amaricoccus solimangrovi]